MPDIISRKTRSQMMSGIRSKNTKPELLIRKGLHKKGFRYRIHCKELPGKPDLVFKKYNAIIFVHGCFWHGHDCHLFKWPRSREAFWRDKINGNIERDTLSENKLVFDGWRIGKVWECALKGKKRLPVEHVIDKCAHWLKSDFRTTEIRGI